jgi:hypothetical protein
VRILFSQVKLYLQLITVFRTMAWAIDLDDGTTIEELGADLNRPKFPTFDPDLFDPNSDNNTDLGT